jgi:hypothetical protein
MAYYGNSFTFLFHAPDLGKNICHFCKQNPGSAATRSLNILETQRLDMTLSLFLQTTEATTGS